MEIDPSLAANAKIAVGAAAGGGVRMFLRPAKSMAQAVMLLGSCVTCGFYGTQPLMDWWTMPADYAGAVGALLGFVGLSLAEAVLRLDFRDVVLRLIGRAAK